MRQSCSRAVGSLVLLSLFIGARSASAQTFFEHIYFEGASFSASSDMNFVGWDWNGRVSSLSIPPGTTVTLYQHIDFGGQSLTVSGDNVDLRSFPGPGADGTWNDEVSSF